MPGILKQVGTSHIPATTAQFIARERYVVNIRRNAPVKISYLSPKFTEWFLSGQGSIEDPKGDMVLRYDSLQKSSMDSRIMGELGGKDRALMTLSDMLTLMKKKRNGKGRVLLKNGYANIFYIEDVNGVLRSVDLRWHNFGWEVGARSVCFQNARISRYRLVSRNSVVVSAESSVPA